MANIEELKKYKHIYMIGIGGVSMSGIAQILKHWGFIVTGSDSCESDTTRKLNLDGIHVIIGHDVNMVSKADLVVYTAAIKDTDPELFSIGNEILRKRKEQLLKEAEEKYSL